MATYSNPESTLGTPDLTVSSVSFFTGPSETVRGQSLFSAVDVTSFDASDYGVLWETGAGVMGFAASLEAGGQLWVAAFDGSPWQDPGQAYLKVDVSSYYNTSGTFYTTIDISTQQFNLYFQPGGPTGGNQAVFLGTSSSTSFARSTWAGGDPGGLGILNSFMVVFGFTNYNSTFTGTVSELRWYYDTAEPSPFQSVTEDVTVTGIGINTIAGTGSEIIATAFVDVTVTGIGINTIAGTGSEIIATEFVDVDVTGIQSTAGTGRITIGAGPWGLGTWGLGEWGFGNPNPIVTPSGIALSTAIGEETTQADAIVTPSGITLSVVTGDETTQANGIVTPNGITLSTAIGDENTQVDAIVTTTGQQLNSSINSVIVDAEVAIGWGRTEWGNLAWGDAYSVQTGSVSAQTAVGAVSTQIGVSTSVQGIALSSTIGNEESFTDAIVTPSGITLSVVTGDEATQADAIVTPNGTALSSAIGNETIKADAIVTPNGTALSSAIGNETIKADAIVTPSGIALTGSIGETQALTIQGTGLSTGVGLVDIQAGGNIFIQVEEHTLDTGIGSVYIEIAVEVFQEGMQLNTFIGDEVAFTDVTVSPAGIALAIAEPEIVVDLNTPVDVTGTEIISTTGIIDANPDANAIGIEAQTSIGQVTSSANANIDVSGNVLNTSIGQVISIGNANIDVTGISLASAIGDEEVSIDIVVEVTGTSMTYALGDIIPESKYSVDGIPLSGAINSVTINANALVTPTGIALTSSIGSLNITAWAEIDPGVNNTWTEIDPGVNNTWTEIDPGVNNTWATVDLAA